LTFNGTKTPYFFIRGQLDMYWRISLKFKIHLSILFLSYLFRKKFNYKNVLCSCAVIKWAAFRWAATLNLWRYIFLVKLFNPREWRILIFCFDNLSLVYFTIMRAEFKMIYIHTLSMGHFFRHLKDAYTITLWSILKTQHEGIS